MHHSKAVQYGFSNRAAATRAASLLGCSLEQLQQAVFNVSTMNPLALKWSALDCLRGFVQCLYRTTVSILLSLINRYVSHGYEITFNHAIDRFQSFPVWSKIMLLSRSCLLPTSRLAWQGESQANRHGCSVKGQLFILDPVGLQMNRISTKSVETSGATLSEFIFNYGFERLSQLFEEDTEVLLQLVASKTQRLSGSVSVNCG